MSVRGFILQAMLVLGGCSLLGCQPVVDGACADGYETCAHTCVPVGTCIAECKTPAPAAASAASPPASAAPVETCGDVSSDPLNCGACGNVCGTGQCADGVCAGKRAGDQIIIGHDYEGTTPRIAMSDVAANAVFMRNRNPTRVLSWQQYADSAATAGFEAVLAAESKRSGRLYVETTAPSTTQVAAEAAKGTYDVIVIHDQRHAPTGELANAGAALRDTLRTFTEAGGVVIVLDGGRGTGEMPSFLDSAGIVSAPAHLDASGTLLDLTTPSDVVASGLMVPYKAPAGTVTWSVVDPSFAPVLSDTATGKPVVLHRVVRAK